MYFYSYTVWGEIDQSLSVNQEFIVILPEFQTKGLVKFQLSNPCYHEHKANPSPLQWRIQIQSCLRRLEGASIRG